MNAFNYERAATIPEALTKLTIGQSSAGRSRFIAGGTNLLDLMKIDVERPEKVVDITRIKALKSITDLPNGGLRLGALVTNADTAYSERVIRRYPMLSQAILAGASPQLRNMATNGGNLLQRTRCYYFYDVATPCNKRDPGSGCGAINGINRIHAILGASYACVAVHPSDMCVALAALGATVQVTGENGDREIAFHDFHRLPGDKPEVDSNLAPGELITAIDLPPQGYVQNYTYLKVRDRASYAFALVSVAAGLEIENGTIRSARLALGGVAHKPWRDLQAEQLLAGKPVARESFIPVAEYLLRDARGLEHNAFKIPLAKRAIVRALEEASGLRERPRPPGMDAPKS